MSTTVEQKPRMRRQQVETPPTLRQQIGQAIFSDRSVIEAESALADVEVKEDALKAELKIPPSSDDPWRHETVRQKLAVLQPELIAAKRAVQMAQQEAASKAMSVFEPARAEGLTNLKESLVAFLAAGERAIELADSIQEFKLPITSSTGLRGIRTLIELLPRLRYLAGELAVNE